MICPECHAEYLHNIKICGDCNKKLINASSIDLPIPKMTWKPLPYFEGKLQADMIAEILDKKDIPYYIKTNWTSSAYGVQGLNTTGDFVKIYVPEAFHEKAKDITLSIIGNN